jgi:hypothetical protein
MNQPESSDMAHFIPDVCLFRGGFQMFPLSLAFYDPVGSLDPIEGILLTTSQLTKPQGLTQMGFRTVMMMHYVQIP